METVAVTVFHLPLTPSLTHSSLSSTPPCSTETIVPVVTDDLLTATAHGHFAALILLKLSVVCDDPRCLCPASGHSLLPRPSQSRTKLTVGRLHPVQETVLDVGLRTRMRPSVHLNGNGRADDRYLLTPRQSSDTALSILSTRLCHACPSAFPPSLVSLCSSLTMSPTARTYTISFPNTNLDAPDLRDL